MIDLNAIANMIRNAPTLVYDAETNGLDWRTCHTVGHVLTFSPDPKDSHYLPIRHTGGGNMDPVLVNAMLKTEIAARPTLRMVFHNADFDLKFLNNDGIVPLGPLEDTGIDAFLVNEHITSFSLSYLCKYFDVQAKKGQDLYDHIVASFPGDKIKNDHTSMEHFHRLVGINPIAVDYATGDGTSTWQLWAKLQAKLDEPDLRGDNLRQIWLIECRVIRVLHRMSLRGIKVDEERLAQVRKIVEEQYTMAKAKLPATIMLNGKQVDWNEKAPTHIRQYFFDNGYKEEDIPRTEPSTKHPTGQMSFKADWLEFHKLGSGIIKARKFRFILDSFLTPLEKEHIVNGRIHPHFNQTRGEEFGTITGRLSCDSPNMQQVHKRNKLLGSLFRSVFVSDPGKKWAAVDYGQCEPRLLAHFGKIKTLIDGYMQDPPMDAHTSVAKAAGIDREPGKRMNQALLTGAGIGRMRELLAEYGAKPDEAERIIKNYFASMPELKGFQKKAAEIYRQRGYIVTLLGRRIHLDDPNFAYTAVNRILQGGNADINKRALADVDELYASEGDECNLLNDVHDDLCQQFSEDNRKTFNRALELMQDYGPSGQSVYLTVPMVVDVGEGPDWAVATYGKETVTKMFKEVGAKYER